MGLAHRGVTLLDFDDTFDWQPVLVSRACERVGLRDVPGTRLFCAAEAFGEICARLSRRTSRGVTFVGSGDRHYVTLALLAGIHRPFDLVLFDRHADMDDRFGDGSPGLLSCGSWLNEAFEHVPNLGRAILVGVSEEAARRAIRSRWRGRLAVWTDGAAKEEAFARIAEAAADDVYVSVDKDVLDRAFAMTNWDHGSMRLDELTEALRALVLAKNVLGADVCGEMPAPPSERWRLSRFARLNERANIAILDAFLACE